MRRLPTISLAVIQTVLAKVGKSRVEERVSARPKGIIGGIQPEKVFQKGVHQQKPKGYHLSNLHIVPTLG
jgi:hypothetical protein